MTQAAGLGFTCGLQDSLLDRQTCFSYSFPPVHTACIGDSFWRSKCVRVQALALAIAQRSKLPTLMTKYDRAPKRTLAQNDCASLASILLRRGDVVVGGCNAR